MREYLPLLIVCAVIGVFTILFLAAYAVLKRKTKEETSERHMSDSEIIKRLLGYARPYKKDFVLVFLIMLVSIAYDVVSPCWWQTFRVPSSRALSCPGSIRWLPCTRAFWRCPWSAPIFRP